MDTNQFNTTQQNSVELDASELCSRKLWQLVSGTDNTNISEKELSAAIQELAKRRHYLEELQKIGKLRFGSNN